MAKADKERSDAEKNAEKESEENKKKALQAEKDRFDERKKLIQDQTDLNRLSLTQQYAEWKKMQDLYAEGTEYRMEIDKQLFKLEEQIANERTALNDKIDGLNQQYNDALKSRTEAILGYIGVTVDLQQREEDLSKSQEDLTEKVKSLTKEKKDLWEQWRKGGDTVEETTELFKKYIEKSNELVDTTKELKTVEEESSKSRATVLIENLRNQVGELENWSGSIQELSKRAIDEGLLEELQKMGPGAVTEIQTLMSMTDDELTEYSELYKKAQSLANDRAVEELGGLKGKITEKIGEVTKDLAKLELPEGVQIGTKIADNIIEGVDGKSGELDNAVQKLADDTAEKFDAAFSGAAENVGAFVDEIITDINSVKVTTKDVTTTVPAMFNTMATTVAAKWTEMWSGLRQKATECVTGIITGIRSIQKTAQDTRDNIMNMVKTAMEDILTMYEDYKESWKSAGAAFVDSFCEGADFQKFVDKVKTAIEDAQKLIAEAAGSVGGGEQLVYEDGEWMTEAQADTRRKQKLYNKLTASISKNAENNSGTGDTYITINSPTELNVVDATHILDDQKKKDSVQKP